MVGENEQLPPVSISDRQEAIFTNCDSCTRLGVDLFTDLQSLWLVPYRALAGIPFPHDTKWVGSPPDSSSVVGRSDSTVRVVND